MREIIDRIVWAVALSTVTFLLAALAVLDFGCYLPDAPKPQHVEMHENLVCQPGGTASWVCEPALQPHREERDDYDTRPDLWLSRL